MVSNGADIFHTKVDSPKATGGTERHDFLPIGLSRWAKQTAPKGKGGQCLAPYLWFLTAGL